MAERGGTGIAAATQRLIGNDCRMSEPSCVLDTFVAKQALIQIPRIRVLEGTGRGEGEQANGGASSAMKLKDFGMARGEWIIHANHGIGQVARLEEKTVGGDNQAYIRVEGQKYDWWISVDSIDETPIRPLRKPSTFKRALRLLKDEPEELPKDAKERRRHIIDMLSVGSPAALCKVVRDLTAMSRTRQLPEEDKRILNKYRQTLLDEWTITLATEKGDAAERLEEYLAEGSPEETG